MRQVTGSNPSPSVNKVSIQLALDGHSFSVAGDIAAAADGVAEVELLTASTLLVPVVLCDEGEGARLLAAAGIAVRPDDEVVCTSATEGDEPLRAVMALPRAVSAALCERMGHAAGEGSPALSALRFTSPLLRGVSASGKCLWMFAAGDLLYIKVYDGGLRLAEVFPAPSVDDALCLLDRLSGVFPLSEFTLCLAGDAGRRWRKAMKRNFREIVCES